MSLKNAVVVGLSRGRQRLLRRISTRKGREAERVVLLEGSRVLETALESGAEILFVAREDGRREVLSPRVTRLLGDNRVQVVGVGTDDLREFTDTEHSQGVLAVAREPLEGKLGPLSAELRERSSGTLILDGVRDPGNAGTLVRVAAAFGLSRVIAVDGTVDPWSAKAVRASAGLIFRTAIHRLGWEELAVWLKGEHVSLIVADPAGLDVCESPPLAAAGESLGEWALLVGNETVGPRSEAFRAADAHVSIPMASGVDSLSVATAGAILLWALGPGNASAKRAPS